MEPEIKNIIIILSFNVDNHNIDEIILTTNIKWFFVYDYKFVFFILDDFLKVSSNVILQFINYFEHIFIWLIACIIKWLNFFFLNNTIDWY